MRSDPSSEDMPTLFRRLASRDGEAFGEICRRFWGKLLAFARSRVRRKPELRRIYDEEDAVGSGLNLMWLRLMKGLVVPPDGVADFMRLARTMITRRITAKLREERAAKRHPSVNADADEGFRFQPGYMPDDLELWPTGLPGPEVTGDLGSDQVSGFFLALSQSACFRSSHIWNCRTIAKKPQTRSDPDSARVSNRGWRRSSSPASTRWMSPSSASKASSAIPGPPGS
jgi:hypothetical protein